MGLGKTRTILKKLIQAIDLSRGRFFVFVPTHELARPIEAIFGELIAELASEGHPVSHYPDAFVIRGREQEGMCNPPSEVVREGVKRSSRAGIGAKEPVCNDCEARNSCPWFGQADAALTAGLKICVTKQIASAAVPGWPRSMAQQAKQDADGVPPIFGALIDEGFRDDLTERIEITLENLCSLDDLSQLLDPCASTNRFLKATPTPLGNLIDVPRFLNAGRLRGLIEAVGRACQSVGADGCLPKEPFAYLFGADHDDPGELRDEDDGTYFRTKIVVLQELLSELMYKAEDAATKVFRESIEDGIVPEVNITELRNHAKIKALNELLFLVRCAGQRKHLQCLEVVGGKLVMNWQRPIPHWLSTFPLLVTDATAHPVLSRIPFSLWDERGGQFIEDTFLKFESVSAEEPYAAHIAILNAPITITKLCRPIEEAQERETGEPKTLERLRQDSNPETILRLTAALTARSETSGLIGNKTFTDYAKDRGGITSGVIAGNFAAVRGRNDWEKVSTHLVAGRFTTSTKVYQGKGAAIFACDPDQREIQLGLETKRQKRGLRLRHQGKLIGVAIPTEVHPCPNLQMVIEAQVLAEHVQAIGRARGARRTKDNPVCIFHINDLVPDITYDAVIDFNDFRLDLGSVILHVYSVLPPTARERRKLAPHLYRSAEQAKKQAQLNEEFRSLLPLQPSSPYAAVAYAHPALAPAYPRGATITLRGRNRHFTEHSVLLDARRAEQGCEAYAMAMGKTFVKFEWDSASTEALLGAGSPVTQAFDAAASH